MEGATGPVEGALLAKFADTLRDDALDRGTQLHAFDEITKFKILQKNEGKRALRPPLGEAEDPYPNGALDGERGSATASAPTSRIGGRPIRIGGRREAGLDTPGGPEPRPFIGEGRRLARSWGLGAVPCAHFHRAALV